MMTSYPMFREPVEGAFPRCQICGRDIPVKCIPVTGQPARCEVCDALAERAQREVRNNRDTSGPDGPVS
jgi:hypothetical protein